MNATREEVRAAIKEAMREGGRIAMDSSIKVIGLLVERFTTQGHPIQALGAGAAMELLKQLRDGTPKLYAADRSEK